MVNPREYKYHFGPEIPPRRLSPQRAALVNMSMLVASTGKPDSCWSWVVCICAALSQAMTMGFLFSFGVLFPVFMEYFRETREKTGECCTAMSLVGFVFAWCWDDIGPYFIKRMSLFGFKELACFTQTAVYRVTT